MATLTEMVAAFVVHSSTAALSHFGVTMDVKAAEPPPAIEQRVVARSPRQQQTAPAATPATPILKASNCPEQTRPHVVRI